MSFFLVLAIGIPLNPAKIICMSHYSLLEMKHMYVLPQGRLLYTLSVGQLSSAEYLNAFNKAIIINLSLLSPLSCFKWELSLIFEKAMIIFEWNINPRIISDCIFLH